MSWESSTRVEIQRGPRDMYEGPDIKKSTASTGGGNPFHGKSTEQGILGRPGNGKRNGKQTRESRRDEEEGRKKEERKWKVVEVKKGREEEVMKPDQTGEE